MVLLEKMDEILCISWFILRLLHGCVILAVGHAATDLVQSPQTSLKLGTVLSVKTLLHIHVQSKRPQPSLIIISHLPRSVTLLICWFFACQGDAKTCRHCVFSYQLIINAAVTTDQYVSPAKVQILLVSRMADTAYLFMCVLQISIYIGVL